MESQRGRDSMKSPIAKLKKQVSRFFAYLASAYCPPPDVKPEDWWRCQLDRMDY